jgi:YVTN family beta-propeller protein
MLGIASTHRERPPRRLWLGAAGLLALACIGLLALALPPPETAAAPWGSGLLASGGPDLFGYTFRDSNEPDGPTYTWEEISVTGTLVAGWTSTDDGYAGSIPIGFTIDYYGNGYDELFVGSNGYVSFGQGYGEIPGGMPPQTYWPNNDAALFGGDMYLYDYGTESAVYYQTLSDPTRFVLEYVNLHWCCGYNTPHTFELVLYPNGDIVAQYQSLNGDTTSYLGIENADGTDGLGYGNSLTDTLAIRYYYPMGVFLIPDDLEGSGDPGTMITYTLWLANHTGATDSFDLLVEPGHTWTTTLSLTRTGSLDDGQSLSFSAWVEIPPLASPGEEDTAIIRATSVTSPTVYSDTATITTHSRGDMAYVTLSGSDLVAVVDTETHDVIETVNVGGAGCDFPWRATMTPDGNQVWIGCDYSGSVVVINTVSNTVVHTVSGIPYADGITFTRDGAYALVGSRSYAQIVVVDTSTYFLTFVPVPGYVRSLVTHPYLDRAYATCSDGTVLVVDTTGYGIIATIPVGDEPWDVAISADGQRVFAGDRWGEGLAVVDTTSNTVRTTVTGLGELTGLEVAPDGSAIYACGLGNGVHVIDGATFDYITTVSAVGTAWEAAATCDGVELYVGNVSSEIPVIDTTTYSVTDQIALPGYPARGIAICPQRVATGVLLSPLAQTNSGARGEVVAHKETLINVTGATDSFELEAGSHLWDTALSTTGVGPIDNGDSITFTVYVTVPADAEWYSTDSVVVTATSVSSPTLYWDTALFTTEAYAPPQINVSPDSLESTQYVGEATTQPLTIGNGNGVTLTFDVITASGASDSLEEVLATLNANYQPVINAIPNRYDFDEGETGYYINDGGNDMYDGGNYLSTNYGGYIEYSNNLIVDSEFFGDGGRYFTRKYPGLFLLVADMEDVDYFEISGNLGADGAGSVDGTILQAELYGVTYYGFVKRVYNAYGDPSVNHLIIVADNPAADHTYSTNTDDDYHHVYNLGPNSRLYYLLYAGSNGFYIDDTATLNIMETFLDALELLPPAPWLSADPASGVVPTYESVEVQVTFDAIAMQPGGYTAVLAVESSDPVTPSVPVPVTMTVLPTADMGWVEGAVFDAGTQEPLEATIIAWGEPYTVTSDPETGYYVLWLVEGSYTLEAQAEGYVSQTAEIEIVAQQGITESFALVLNAPVMQVTHESMEVTQQAGEVTTRVMTITNAGPAPLGFAIRTGPAVYFSAVSRELYGYQVPYSWLTIIGTEDDTYVRVLDLTTGAVFTENPDLDRYETWEVYPATYGYFKVEADKPVVGYDAELTYDGEHSTFVPSLLSGPVGREFIYYQYQDNDYFLFAIENTDVEIYDASGSLVASQSLPADDYWQINLPDAVYHIVSTGRIAIEAIGENSYSTVPSAAGAGVGRRFFFATEGFYNGAFAVFAYQDADVEVYDLDTGDLLWSNTVTEGTYWWNVEIGSRRLLLESTGDVEVWAGDAEGGNEIQNLGDDISFAGGMESQEFYLHSLMDGSVVFAPFDNTRVDVDGGVYYLNKDEYLHLEGCCYFRHIRSNQPIIIQTLGRDSSWNDMGTYLAGTVGEGEAAVSWLLLDPDSGTVPPYSSLPVDVTFDAVGLQPGEYSADLVIQSNDPFTPSVTIPATMTVEPTADMGAVSGLVLDAWTGAPLVATVELAGVYSMTASPDYLIWAPAGTYDLSAFTPGYYTTTVPVTIVAGEMVTQDLALEPAQSRLEWAPGSIAATATEGTQVTQTLIISNTGPLLLEIALHEISPSLALLAPSPDDLSGKTILYDMAHGEPWWYDYSYLVDDLIAAGAVITENWTYPIDASVLEGCDVLWVNCCGYTNWTYGELSAVSDWMDEGGAVLVQGESSPATTGPASIWGINYEYGSCTEGTTTNVTEHPISAGVDAVYVEWTCYRLAPGGGADIVVFDPYDQPHVAAQEQDGGKMVVVASEDLIDWVIDYEDNRLLANNILAWLARPGYSDVPWLSETPEAATIPGHSQLAITLAFDARALSPGDYEAIVAIEHNDPGQADPAELPVTLTVVERQAGLSLAPILQQGNGRPGDTVVYTVTLTNEGNYTDTFTLEVSGLWPADVSAEDTGPLAAGESMAFQIEVTVPISATYGMSDTTTITGRSVYDPDVSASAQVVTSVAPPRNLYLPVVLRNS